MGTWGMLTVAAVLWEGSSTFDIPGLSHGRGSLRTALFNYKEVLRQFPSAQWWWRESRFLTYEGWPRSLPRECTASLSQICELLVIS